MSIVASTRFISLQTLEYPLSLAEIRQIYPNISIPSNPTESQLIELGYAVVDPQLRPTGDVISEGAPELIGERWQQVWEVRGFTTEEILEDLNSRKMALQVQINQMRDAELVLPIPYEFTPGVVEHIQMRSDDQFNLTHLRLEATTRVSNNDTTMMGFRTLENTTRMLTPTEMLTMTAVPLTRVKAVYQASWTLKDQITAAQTIAELPAIPTELVPFS